MQSTQIKTNTNTLPLPQTRKFYCRPELLLGILLLLAFALRIYHLDYRGFWTDEFKTLKAARLSVPELARERLHNGHFPTYFLLVHAAVRLADESESVLRFPSVIAGTLSLFMLFLLARRLWGVQCALWAALFFAFHGRAIWASQEARPYAFAMLAALGSTHALVTSLQTNSRRWWTAFTLWSLFGMLVHATYPFTFAGQCIVMLVWMIAQRRWNRSYIFSILSIIIISAICYSIIPLFQDKSDRFLSHRQWPSFKFLRDSLMNIFWGDVSNVSKVDNLLKNISYVLFLLVGWLSWRQRKSAQSPSVPGYALIVSLAISTLVGMTLSSGLLAGLQISQKYCATEIGGGVILIALAITSVINGKLRLLFASACFLTIATIGLSYPFSKGEQVREAIQYVSRHRTPDEKVLFCKGSGAEIMCEYYKLGIAPVPVSRNLTERLPVVQLLDETVSNEPQFWLILYDRRDCPIESVLSNEFGHAYTIAKRKEFEEATAIHYVKPGGLYAGSQPAKAGKMDRQSAK